MQCGQFTAMEQATGAETMQIGAEWPAPAPQQVEVMLLGTYHMDGGVDEVEFDVDDVLSEDRQRELRTLTDTLAEWNPDLVAVERPHERSQRVNDLYREYRQGDRAYNEESEIDPPHPARSEIDTECRSEVVQIGFRLADQLDHSTVAPVDYTSYDLIEREYDDEFVEAAREFEERWKAGDEELPEKVGIPAVNEEYTESLFKQLRSQSIPEHLVKRNREPNIRTEQYLSFGHRLRMTHDGLLVGPRSMTVWYDRNIRMCHFLWREMDETTDRICFIVGDGHVSILRSLLTEVPMFCPVSPLPYLRKAAKQLQD